MNVNIDRINTLVKDFILLEDEQQLEIMQQCFEKVMTVQRDKKINEELKGQSIPVWKDNPMLERKKRKELEKTYKEYSSDEGLNNLCDAIKMSKELPKDKGEELLAQLYIGMKKIAKKPEYDVKVSVDVKMRPITIEEVIRKEFSSVDFEKTEKEVDRMLDEIL